MQGHPRVSIVPAACAPFLGRVGLASALLVVPACRDTAVFPLAVGARGTLPTWNGPCAGAARRGDSVALVGDGFVAEHAGITDLACRDGRLRLDVRDVAMLSVDGPSTLGTAWATYRVVASDRDGRALDLGEASVVWSIPEGIERDGSCHGDLLPVCEPPSTVRLRARGSGSAEIRASLGTTGSSLTIVIRR